MNTNSQNQYRDELQRLRGVIPDGPTDLSGPTRIFGKAAKVDATIIVERVRAVLTIANEAISSGKDAENVPASEFPDWFVDACAGEPDWDLLSWLSWFEASERTWFWWDGRATDETSLVVEVVSDGLPFLWGALEWLLLAAGCEQVEIDLW